MPSDRILCIGDVDFVLLTNKSVAGNLNYEFRLLRRFFLSVRILVNGKNKSGASVRLHHFLKA